MRGQITKHTKLFFSKRRRDDETSIASLRGYIESSERSELPKTGALILSDQRLCFVRAGMFGEIFTEFDLTKITSLDLEKKLALTYLRIVTSGNDIEFVTGEQESDISAFLEDFRNARPSTVEKSNSADDPISALERLGTLRDASVITQAEFEEKKAELLSRI